MYRKMNDIHLAPSDYYWGVSPEKIHTVLGSCISVTIWNPVKKTGGMCHYLLTRSGSYSEGKADGRYCEDSFSLLMDYVKKEKLKTSQYEVKIFGGAAMFGDGISRIGDGNIRCAEEILKEYGFSVAAKHVGGEASRHIVFELETGDVWVKTNRGILIPEAQMDACRDESDINPSMMCIPSARGAVYG